MSRQEKNSDDQKPFGNLPTNSAGRMILKFMLEANRINQFESNSIGKSMPRQKCKQFIERQLNVNIVVLSVLEFYWLLFLNIYSGSKTKCHRFYLMVKPCKIEFKKNKIIRHNVFKEKFTLKSEKGTNVV